MRPRRTALTAVAAVGVTALGGALVALPAWANGESHHPGHRVIHGTVSALDADGFTVTNQSGAHDVLTTSATRYSESGDPSSPTGVAVGQLVLVKVARDAATPGSGTSSSASASAGFEPVATRVSILLKSLRGKVTGLSGASVTLARPDGRTATVLTGAGTVLYSRTRAADGSWTTMPVPALADNDLVTVFGEPDATTPADLDAFFVRVRSTAPVTSNQSADNRPVVTASVDRPAPPAPAAAGAHDQSSDHDQDPASSATSGSHWVRGTVASVNGDDIVIDTPDGSQVTVVTGATTKYRSTDCDHDGDAAGAGGTSPAVAANDKIAALVEPVNGQLDARQVDYAPANTGDHDFRSTSPSSAPQSQPPRQDQASSGPPSGSYSGHRSSGGPYGGNGYAGNGGGGYGGGRDSRH